MHTRGALALRFPSSWKFRSRWPPLPAERLLLEPQPRCAPAPAPTPAPRPLTVGISINSRFPARPGRSL
eukprot:2319662-Pleurochrysis_carterae.AAC.1